MHWEWKNCSTAWKGKYTTGFKGKNPTIILEAVADYLHWGSRVEQRHQRPPVVAPFNEQCMDVGPPITFVANGNQHNMSYYLADGICPRWPVFVKTIKCPIDPKKIYFAQRQEAARKDVERAFGVLQA
ncbi:uncharacterized protein LOC121752842 [Salvia splendens]|uniref:uncharacterized protein LOC121752842 n=1 Tax=Salvia splendens TaxID=180675 RepID=UPI001C27D78D|nr:uncharacterized protein LOC121752842 [Salvia splendens]